MTVIFLEGIQMFGRRKRQQQYLDGADEIAFKQVLQAASAMTFPGDPITPDGVHRAAQSVAMEVVQGAMQGGASARDCSMLMAIYTDMGQRVGQMFAPGGPMHGATSPEMDER